MRSFSPQIRNRIAKVIEAIKKNFKRPFQNICSIAPWRWAVYAIRSRKSACQILRFRHRHRVHRRRGCECRGYLGAQGVAIREGRVDFAVQFITVPGRDSRSQVCESVTRTTYEMGASDFDVAYHVVLKQIMPRERNSIRLNLKAGMLFLFAGEMIASTDRLAYRIALLRRHMEMDVIIPYVLWVALLLFLVDLGMRMANRWIHPWLEKRRPHDPHQRRFCQIRM